MRLRQLDISLLILGISVAVLSAGCFILYVGLGIIYGSYVGLESRGADLQFVSMKMRRAVSAAWLLQLILVAIVWIVLVRTTSRETRVPAMIGMLRTAIIVVVTDMSVVAVVFVLGRLGFPPVIFLLQWLDEIASTGIR